MGGVEAPFVAGSPVRLPADRASSWTSAPPRVATGLSLVEGHRGEAGEGASVPVGSVQPPMLLQEHVLPGAAAVRRRHARRCSLARRTLPRVAQGWEAADAEEPRRARREAGF